MHIESLEELVVFTQIVESGNLSAAARNLGMAPNTVSRRLASLEARLDVPLVLRTTRSVSITADGRVFYDRCVQILAAVDAAEVELKGSTHELAGTLRVGVPTLLAKYAHSAIAELLKTHPKLSLELRISDQRQALLAEGLDAAVVVGTPAEPSLIARRIITLKMALAATPAYLKRRGTPQTVADLEHHECLRFLSDTPQHQWTLTHAAGHSESVQVNGRFSANDSRALEAALLEGLGIGIRTEAALSKDGPVGRLTRVLPDWTFMHLDLWFVYPAARRGTQKIKRLAEAMIPVFQALMQPN